MLNTVLYLKQDVDLVSLHEGTTITTCRFRIVLTLKAPSKFEADDILSVWRFCIIFSKENK